MTLLSMLKVSTVSLALLGGFGAAAATAKSLNAAVGLGPKNNTMIAYQAFADYVAENSDVDIKVFSMSLLSLKETAPGIRDGLADLGFVITLYYPAEYSESNLAANLSMLSTAGKKVDSPGAALAGAMTEYVFNCPDCLAEYKEQKQVYLGSVASNSYDLLCTTPIATLADLAGKKMRSPGGNYSRWAEKLGATGVTLPIGDTYEGLSQGVIDCTMSPVSDLTNNSFVDVAKYVTLGAPGGAFAGVATSNFNEDVWQDLTDEERTVILKGASRMQAQMTLDYYALAAKDAVGAPGMGVELVEPAADLIAATDAFVQDDIAVIEEQFSSDYGIEGAAGKIAEMTRLIEKWKDLTADLAEDPEALADVYWEQIFSKIDPTSFGMN